jgi:hypothetical protein
MRIRIARDCAADSQLEGVHGLGATGSAHWSLHMFASGLTGAGKMGVCFSSSDRAAAPAALFADGPVACPGVAGVG